MELIGHRGLMAEVSQNTLQSFDHAIRRGIRIIELDVVLCKSGEVMVFHDDDVEKITRNQAIGDVSNFTYDELKKLNVHDGFNDGKFYQIPSLIEVLELVDQLASELGHRAKVNVELKGSNTAEPVAKLIDEYVTKGFTLDDFIISSFRHNELETFRQLIPSIDIAVLIDSDQWESLGKNNKAVVELTKTLGGVALNPDIDFVTQDLVNTAHASGLRVNVWTIETQEDYDTMKRLGVDAVFTNTLKLNR
jgi:glycerophosphoryl diester phosphodiesterase